MLASTPADEAMDMRSSRRERSAARVTSVTPASHGARCSAYRSPASMLKIFRRLNGSRARKTRAHGVISHMSRIEGRLRPHMSVQSQHLGSSEDLSGDRCRILRSLADEWTRVPLSSRLNSVFRRAATSDIEHSDIDISLVLDADQLFHNSCLQITAPMTKWPWCMLKQLCHHVRGPA